ncbi:hypothetical protein RAL01_000614 [Vibrio vulnificus]|uniref:hypothetical protein n=1 Tax=Vibrio vulnificus TaxID=672 RepID=UPI00102A2BB6|nr:hypothetical protein [Vibrio vulnificus]EGQ8022024.1 hypothetical protein [Vibrio vulnificus]EJN6709494.1 hypothetical protein [Vibrio vulnificus]ELG4948429.1 hypothetical protein [Vibrio vulnificus]RZP56305.1 hypothetical protein D8T48_13890 [Vibrio vulnificus]RZQ77454.1 hypothetical protein D8T30_04010 [Vibrio vulnificus]
MIFRYVVGLTMLISLSGCGNLNSIHRNFDVSDGNGALIDIKQRAILVSKTSDSSQPIVCAEPSPDALSAYAAELGVQIPQKVGVATSSQEASAYTGLRTQSIQLLRDGMYRLCEAYMGGAIDSGMYGILIRRYQKNMVALLAVEQLTQTIQSPPLALTTQSSASVAQDIELLNKQLEQNKEKVNTLTEQKTKLIESIGNNDANDAQKLELDTLNKQIKDLSEANTMYEKAIVNSQGIITGGSSNVYVHTISNSNNANLAAVHKSVTEIVTKIIDSDDFETMCLMTVLDEKAEADSREVCMNVLKLNLELRRHNLDMAKATKQVLPSFDNTIKNHFPSLDPEIIQKLLESNANK